MVESDLDFMLHGIKIATSGFLGTTSIKLYVAVQLNLNLILAWNNLHVYIFTFYLSGLACYWYYLLSLVNFNKT